MPLVLPEGHDVSVLLPAFPTERLGRHGMGQAPTSCAQPFAAAGWLKPSRRETSPAARAVSSPSVGMDATGRRNAGPETLRAATTAPPAPRMGAATPFRPISYSSTV